MFRKNKLINCQLHKNYARIVILTLTIQCLKQTPYLKNDHTLIQKFTTC